MNYSGRHTFNLRLCPSPTWRHFPCSQTTVLLVVVEEERGRGAEEEGNKRMCVSLVNLLVIQSVRYTTLEQRYATMDSQVQPKPTKEEGVLSSVVPLNTVPLLDLRGLVR